MSKKNRRPQSRNATTVRFPPDVIGMVDDVSGSTGWSWNLTAAKLIRLGAASLAGDIQDAEAMGHEITVAVAKKQIRDDAEARCKALTTPIPSTPPPSTIKPESRKRKPTT